MVIDAGNTNAVTGDREELHSNTVEPALCMVRIGPLYLFWRNIQGKEMHKQELIITA